MRPLNSMLKRAASGCLSPLARRAARSYIAGPALADALLVAGGLARRGFSTTLGFWDGQSDSPSSVAAEYSRAIAALTAAEDGCYLSIKLPALGDSRELLEQVLEQARVVDKRLHFDSLAPEMADAMWSAAVSAANANGEISCSLPGRWRRSVADAATAIEAGIVPRVVKGQWPDSEDRGLDMRVGFMNVVRRLAGRAPHVAVASHDIELARDAIQVLRAADTTCELELLYGLPQRAAVAMARQEAVPVRFYVPYGGAYLPYCLGQIRRQPRLLCWLVRDALRRG